MRHFGSRRRGRARKTASEFIQHSPALKGNQPNNLIGLIHVFAHAGSLAGGSMSAGRMDEDRLTEVANGRTIGNTNITIALVPGVNTNGYLEYAVIKYERSTSVPTIGTDPVPSSADIATNGLQQEVRSMTPGYCVKWGIIPVTAEVTKTFPININWNKFRKGKVRDGDYYTIIIFNNTSNNALVYDLFFRYKTYSL